MILILLFSFTNVLDKQKNIVTRFVIVFNQRCHATERILMNGCCQQTVTILYASVIGKAVVSTLVVQF